MILHFLRHVCYNVRAGCEIDKPSVHYLQERKPMITVTSRPLEERLDKVWYRLQRVVENRIAKKTGHSISQVAIDEATVEELEKTVGYLEAEAQRN